MGFQIYRHDDLGPVLKGNHRSCCQTIYHAMCLIITVRLAETDAVRTQEICRAAEIPVCSEKQRLFSFSRRSSGVLQIPGPEGSCGCSFLTDSADWGAPTWDMIPATLPRLSGILRSIRQHTSTGFSFEALWVGESPTEERHVTIDELVQLVELSGLGTKTRYVVG